MTASLGYTQGAGGLASSSTQSQEVGPVGANRLRETAIKTTVPAQISVAAVADGSSPLAVDSTGTKLVDSGNGGVITTLEKLSLAPARSAWFKLNEGTGTSVVDSLLTNNTMTIQGVATGSWTSKYGVSSNGTLTVVETAVLAQLREILNLRTMVPGKTQILVSFLLTHPTGLATPAAPLFWWGVSASNGWGLEVNASTLWVDFVTRAAGSSAVKVTDTAAQGTMTLPFKPSGGTPGVVTQTALCFEIMRSAAVPGQYEISVYRRPIGAPTNYSNPEIDSIICTANEAHNGSTNLPSWTNSGALTLFGRPNADQSTMVSIAPAGYAIANLVMQRRSTPSQTLGRKTVVNQANAATAGFPYIFPIPE
ncbi:hypothetical protein [Bacteriophage sp.]|nr:hypothetical protein [Bacteriophage sp.]